MRRNIFVEPQQLPANGTYTIVIDPSGPGTGQTTTNLYNVTDVTGSVTINGAALPVTTTVPGQNANITFSGTSGQLATVRLASSTFSCVTVALVKPDGTNLTSTFLMRRNLQPCHTDIAGYRNLHDQDRSKWRKHRHANVSVTNP